MPNSWTKKLFPVPHLSTHSFHWWQNGTYECLRNHASPSTTQCVQTGRHDADFPHLCSPGVTKTAAIPTRSTSLNKYSGKLKHPNFQPTQPAHHNCIKSLSLSFTHMRALSVSVFYSQSHSVFYSQSHSVFYSQSHSLCLELCFTHNLTLSVSVFYSQSHSLCVLLTISLSLSLCFTHNRISLSLSLCFTHNLTLFLSAPLARVHLHSWTHAS